MMAVRRGVGRQRMTVGLLRSICSWALLRRQRGKPPRLRLTLAARQRLLRLEQERPQVAFVPVRKPAI
jgi:hypothetical protein